MRESTHQATRRTNQPIHYDPPCVQKTVLTYSNSIQIYYRSSWIYMDLHGKSEGLHPTKNISKFPTLISTWPRQEKFPVGWDWGSGPLPQEFPASSPRAAGAMCLAATQRWSGLAKGDATTWCGSHDGFLRRQHQLRQWSYSELEWFGGPGGADARLSRLGADPGAAFNIWQHHFALPSPDRHAFQFIQNVIDHKYIKYAAA